MPEFWENAFQEKQAMWGQGPAQCAVEIAQVFADQACQKILIPGYGYGRNATPFLQKGMTITGIEISETAIAMAKGQLGPDILVHHGSVSGMPFDQEQYDGIFCYALIHLLDTPARAKLIADCYRQLKPGGQMVFVAISTQTPNFGEGVLIEENTYRTRHGITLYHYDEKGILSAFGNYGLRHQKIIQEPANSAPGKPYQIFWQITCMKTRIDD